MTRFTVDIPDDLNEWLVEQAEKDNRSKNKQIAYLLESIRAEGVTIFQGLDILVNSGKVDADTGERME